MGNKSSPKSFGKSASPLFTAENALACFVCYYLYNDHCRRVQSLSRGYATSTQKCHTCPICYIAYTALSDPPPKKNFAPS